MRLVFNPDSVEVVEEEPVEGCASRKILKIEKNIPMAHPE